MFLVFAYDTYYPAGGWNDLKGSFKDFEEAKEFAESILDYKNTRRSGLYEWVDVIDLSDEREFKWVDGKVTTEKFPRKMV